MSGMETEIIFKSFILLFDFVFKECKLCLSVKAAASAGFVFVPASEKWLFNAFHVKWAAVMVEFRQTQKLRLA